MADNSDGTVTFTPDTNYAGLVTFTYTVSDTHGATVTGSASLTESAVGLSVAAAGGGGYEGHPVTGTVTGTDANNDTMSYHIVGGGGALSASLAGTLGTLSIDPVTGAYTYTPSGNATGTDSFTVQVDNGHGGVVDQTVTISLAANPINVGIGGGVGTAGSAVTGSVSAADTAHDVLTYTLVGTDGGAAHGTVSINSGDGSYTYTPGSAYVGTDDFQVSITDIYGDARTVTVTVTENSAAGLSQVGTVLHATTATSLADADFTGISGATSLVFDVAGGAQGATLGSNAAAAGITSVDASATSGPVIIDASALAQAVTLTGGSGNDTLTGGAGNDTITGGGGGDTLTGGGGSNVFVYTNPSQTTNGMSGRDIITDFTTGTDHIKISLTGTHVDVSTFEANAGSYNGGQETLAGGGVVGDGFYSSLDSALYIYVTGTTTDIGTDGGYVIGSANQINAADLQFDITGTSGNDTLVGGVGGDTIHGVAGNDIIQVTTGALGLDTIDGGTGASNLVLSDAGTVVDADFAHVTNMTGGLVLHDGDVVTLGTYSEAAGIVQVDAALTTGAVAVDASARTDGVTFHAGSGADTFLGGGGDDHFLVSTGVLALGNDIYDGGAGVNNIVLTDAGVLTDAAFAHVTHMNQSLLVLHDGDVVTLGANWQASGMSGVDASQTTGAVTVDASATTGAVGFSAGSGTDVFTGGNDPNSNNTIGVSTAALANDTFTGGAGTNSLDFTDSGTVLDSAFAHVSNMQNLGLSGGDVVVLGSYSQAAGIHDVSVSWAASWSVIDASARTDTLSLLGGDGADTLIAGSGTTSMTGGAGADTFVASSTGTAVISDFQTNTDTIELDNSKFGLGSSGTLAASNYAADTNAADTISSTAHDFNSGTHSAGVVAISDGSGGATLWYTADMAAATSANSQEFAHVTNVNTAALDQTQFHLHV